MNELQEALLPAMAGMVDELVERVYETLNFFLQEYYNSYDPLSYRSSFIICVRQPRVVGNKYQVATWANQGLHGGTISGNNTPHVWDDTIENTVDNGELLRLAVDYLKSKGIALSGK